MKFLLLLAILLAACQGHFVQKWPPPIHIRPHVAPAATEPILMPTITPDGG